MGVAAAGCTSHGKGARLEWAILGILVVLTWVVMVYTAGPLRQVTGQAWSDVACSSSSATTSSRTCETVMGLRA